MRKVNLIAAVLLFLGTSSAFAAEPQTFEVKVTPDGFVPSTLKVKAGQPVRLKVTRVTDKTCAKEMIIEGYVGATKLPLNKAVDFTFTPAKAGTIRYMCGDKMIVGTLDAQ